MYPTDSHYLFRQAHNDLRVVAGHGVSASGFTLLALIRNEMYFLPSFLSHYRHLGVERFVFLDDRSDDGTREFLLAQPDVVIVESSHAFGEVAGSVAAFPGSGAVRDRRFNVLWRSMLCDMFAAGKWAVVVDLDEFICVPDGYKLTDLVGYLDRFGLRVAWGVMLDMYPRDLAALEALSHSSQHCVDADWYFDGERHVRLRKHKGPRIMYAGARARLHETYGVNSLYSKLGVSTKPIRYRYPARLWSRPRYLRYNAIQKPVLVKWGGRIHHGCPHTISASGSTRHLLPIMHFRFTGALYRRIQMAVDEDEYYNHSADYHLLSELLATMKKRSGSFLYDKSRRVSGYAGFRSTGNAALGRRTLFGG